MKIFIATLILGASFPVNAYESIGERTNKEVYVHKMDMHTKTSASVMNTGNNIYQAMQGPLVMSNLLVRKFLSHVILIAMFIIVIITKVNLKLHILNIKLFQNVLEVQL